MHSALKKHLPINGFEVGLVALLVIVASFRTFYGVAGSFVALSHAFTLLVCFTLVRAFIGNLNETLARVFFAFILLLFIAENLTQYLTSLHLNWFVLSLLLEDDSAANIGISYTQWGLVPAISVGIALWLRSRYFNTPRHLPLFSTLGTAILVFLSGQFVFSVSYFHGAPEMTRIERGLPFFWSPHPYLAQKILTPLIGTRAANPFADTKIERAIYNPDKSQKPLELAENAPNILIIVTDSVRAQDIAAEPALAPNLMKAGEDGRLSLNHYSTSNCTHFSFYSLFSGRLATTFGEARQRGVSMGLMNDLVSAGYSATTAEADSLDWYDTSKLIFPPQTQRWIAEAGNDGDITRDEAVTVETIAQLGTWQNKANPSVHVAYYQGSHYPYQTAQTLTNGPSYKVYRETLTQFDRELDKVLSALKSSGLDENTIVIVTSDHGEEFLAEGLAGHGSRINDAQIVVPLLILGGSDAAQNVRSHMDIRQFVLNQIMPEHYATALPRTVYLANCDYDYPKNFKIITPNGAYDFAFNDGYLLPLGEASSHQLDAAQKLIKIIRNGGLPDDVLPEDIIPEEIPEKIAEETAKFNTQQ